MNSRILKRVCATAILSFAPLAVSLAQGVPHYQGLINDHSPSTVGGGPWEFRGTWSLDLIGDSGTADFSAVLTMQTSDYGIIEGIVNPAVPSTRSPHTHQITMTGASVSSDISACPANSPATTTGFVVSGAAFVAANGAPAPFQVKSGLSSLQICITGGTDVEYSNITLVFSAPASGHFGSQPIHGAVQ